MEVIVVDGIIFIVFLMLVVGNVIVRYVMGS